MNPTHLIYLEDMQALECDASVMTLGDEDGRTFVVLDQTVLYAQGGGQPFDQGYLRSEMATFSVEDVRFIDGIVKHYGSFESGTFVVGENIHCVVDPARRQLHARLHSGGHLVDMAVTELSLTWTPGKGYHFPDGPYVEYVGSLEGVDRDTLKERMQVIITRLASTDLVTRIAFMEQKEMAAACHFVSEYLPAGKPGRVVFYGDFGVPCGGTHVANLNEVGPMVIRDIKEKKGAIRVSYQVESSLTA